MSTVGIESVGLEGSQVSVRVVFQMRADILSVGCLLVDQRLVQTSIDIRVVLNLLTHPNQLSMSLEQTKVDFDRCVEGIGLGDSI